jgi:hypothetical protein
MANICKQEGEKTKVSKAATQEADSLVTDREKVTSND